MQSGHKAPSRQSHKSTHSRGGRQKEKSCFSRHHHCQHSHSAVASFLPAAAAAAIVCSFNSVSLLSSPLLSHSLLILNTVFGGASERRLFSVLSVSLFPLIPLVRRVRPRPRPSARATDRPSATFLSGFTDELLLLLARSAALHSSLNFPAIAAVRPFAPQLGRSVG